MKATKAWRKRKCEKDGRAGLNTSYSLSVSRTAENLSRIDYWDLMFHCAPLASLSLSFSFFICLSTMLSPCLVPNLSAQNRGSKVSQRTFPFLLMLQLFPGWFDNINCCPQCYWWADLSQSASAQLRPWRIKPLAEPRPVGPALIQGAKA